MKYAMLMLALILTGCASTPRNSYVDESIDQNGVYHKFVCTEVEMPDDETHTGKKEPREPREPRIGRFNN